MPRSALHAVVLFLSSLPSIECPYCPVLSSQSGALQAPKYACRPESALYGAVICAILNGGNGGGGGRGDGGGGGGDGAGGDGGGGDGGGGDGGGGCGGGCGG